MGDRIDYLPEGSSRFYGREAQRLNIAAARLLAETVRTTLGPMGMDKMLVDSSGDVIVTNDGVTILEEMYVEHPAAKMLVDVARAQESSVGDGTTTVVVLAGELLKKAESLLEQDVHPTVVAKGFRLAADYSLGVLESLARKVSVDDVDLLKSVVLTSMTGKSAEGKEFLAGLVVDAALKVFDGELNVDFVKVEKRVGGGVEDSLLVDGVVLDRERVHPGMPVRVENAKILLLDFPLEVRSTETDAKITITEPEKLQAFLDMEERMIRDLCDTIVGSGANVVITQKGVDEVAQHFLAKKGVFVLRRVKRSDLEKLSKATNARVLSSLDGLSSEDLGFAGVVEEVRFNDEPLVFVRDCPNPKAVTLLIRGGSEHVVDEVERAVEDGLGSVAATLRSGLVLPGAGAVEVELSRRLRAYADSLSGREQLAVLAFADALEVVPRTLAENAGLDPIDVLASLRAVHDKSRVSFGLDVFSGKPVDSLKAGVLEPFLTKSQALKSATEVAVLLLRIDDVIARGPLDDDKK